MPAARRPLPHAAMPLRDYHPTTGASPRPPRKLRGHLVRTCAAGRKATAARSLTRPRCHAAASTCLSASTHHIDSHHDGVLLVIGWQLTARLMATCTQVWARQRRRQRRRQPGSPRRRRERLQQGCCSGLCFCRLSRCQPSARPDCAVSADLAPLLVRCEGTACLRASH